MLYCSLDDAWGQDIISSEKKIIEKFTEINYKTIIKYLDENPKYKIKILNKYNQNIEIFKHISNIFKLLLRIIEDNKDVIVLAIITIIFYLLKKLIK
jgi:hypothetical protein